MLSGTIHSRRYTKHIDLVGSLNEQYTIPHKIRPAAKDVLIVGSGGGVDIEAALLAGAERVDALEIDPVIIRDVSLTHRSLTRILWLFDQLISMGRSSSASIPLIYTKSTGQVIILAAQGSALQPSPEFKTYRQVQRKPPEIAEALDDWPYLYLRARSIPLDYCITIGFLVVVSLLFIF